MAQHLEDWIAETPESIAARLDGAKTAQRQTRVTLAMMAVISMMMLISAYNAYLSFDSRWILARAAASPPASGTVADVLTRQALQDWAASRNVQVSLVGIRISVDDAPVLGTVALFVFSLWLLLVTRRENHTVGSLLRDTDSAIADADAPVPDAAPGKPYTYSNSQRWLIFHTIVANSLFVTFDRSLARVQSLRGVNPLMGHGTKGVRGRLGAIALGFARNFFFWFPVVVSTFIFYLDRLSYFQPDPFSASAAVPGMGAPFFFESMAVFLVCWVPLVICCVGSGKYSEATDNVLREYGKRLQTDLLRHNGELQKDEGWAGISGAPSPAS